MGTKFIKRTAIIFAMAMIIFIAGVAGRAQETGAADPGTVDAATQLKIIPAPKKAVTGADFFTFNADTYILLCDPANESHRFAAELLRDEIRARLSLDVPVLEKSRPVGGQIVIGNKNNSMARLAARMHNINADDAATPEGYILNVSNSGMLLLGADDDGAFYAAQSLRQLVRGAAGATLPAMRIDDWPDFHFRGITDDISRGPIPTMDTIKTNIARLAEFKINKLNFYIEHVFCFEKHPDIGPEGGCLTAGDLREIEAFAKQYHIELIGGMQSFGHLYHVLKLARYAPLAENPLQPWSITPARDASYELMDDLYSEIAPAVSSPLFNISCDETFDLGTGQSREMVEEQGIAAVYAGHIIKLHGLLAKHSKRVMMWADIALKHPDILWMLPEDIIFLAWAYSPRDDFNDMLEPIRATGHDFIVCPGVNCWSRMFPNLNNAIPNIANFSRDGAKYNALGVLNTTWDDDGENLFGFNWFPIAWGAENSWNPTTADFERFKGSFSQSFYGTAGDSAARGIEQFMDAENIMDYNDLSDSLYWSWPPSSMFPSAATAEADAKRLLKYARRAISAFTEAKQTATANAENIDYLLFAAHRLEELANRRITYYRCAKAYAAAVKNQTDRERALKILDEIESKIQDAKTGLTQIRDEYKSLWLRENRPYWLDNILKKYDDVLAKLAATREAVNAAATALESSGAPLPDPETVGLQLPEAARQEAPK